jgi:hypothetical protein
VAVARYRKTHIAVTLLTVDIRYSSFSKRRKHNRELHEKSTGGERFLNIGKKQFSHDMHVRTEGNHAVVVINVQSIENWRWLSSTKDQRGASRKMHNRAHQ